MSYLTMKKINLCGNDVSVRYPSRAADLLEDLNDYEKSYLRVKITLNDIAALKKTEPRKSVLNFTAEELSSTSAFAQVLKADIDKKSPFFRAKNGEWRDSDEHTVLIIEVEYRKSDFKCLFASMPSERQQNGTYKGVGFPVKKVAKEVREVINSAVLGAYEKLEASSEKTMKFDIDKPEKVVSKVYTEMNKVESDKTQAAGQLTIDGCLVVTDVKLNEGTNVQGQAKNLVAMPSKPNKKGGYDDIAFPITSEFRKSVDKSVMAAVNNIGRYEYKGVKYAELGENPASSAPLPPEFADKLMTELTKQEFRIKQNAARKP